ncbi:LysR family transcriptional regulator [Streptomyces sp. NPDC001719]
MTMTLRQFQYLVTIVDTGSFTRAAERLHVSQPALSRQIQTLERSCGGPLIERGPRPIVLTPLGRAVLPHAQAALAGADKVKAAALRVSGTAGGELRLATLHSISLGVLPPVLRAWRRTHSDVRVMVAEQPHATALQNTMAAGRADVAIGPVPTEWTGRMTPLGTEEFVVVMAHDDPAVQGLPSAAYGGSRIRLTDLAHREWVHYASDNGLAKLLDHVCARAGFEPRAAVRTQQTAAAPLLAAAGIGPALVPANIVPAHFDGRVLLPEPAVRRPLTVYTRHRPDPLTVAFVETLNRHASVTPPHLAAGATPPYAGR